MRSRQIICLFMVCIFLFYGCYSEHLIGVQDMKTYEKPKILRIEMQGGEVIEYKSDEIIMSKQDNNGLLLYFGDGSTRVFYAEDIQSIKIQKYEAERTIGLFSGILGSILLVLIIYGFSQVQW